MSDNFNIDCTYSHLSPSQKSQVVNDALSRTQAAVNDLDFKSMITKDGDKIINDHEIEAINKFTVALSCLIFFFIGAPLGAIIRKGGLGIPVIISVLVFIIYYILDNSGYRMARGGMWSVWFGKGLATAVLLPIAVFVTYKANKDSVVFNIDLYIDFIRMLLGPRIKRHLFGKEVVIEGPDYTNDAMRLEKISNDVYNYSKKQKLIGIPNPLNVFFKYHPDHEIERISQELEDVINDLSNTRDNYILSDLNNYPVVSVKAHTRPFERKWMNITSAVLVPLGLFFYFRMLMFRLRLLHDLKTIKQTNDNITRRISGMKTIK